MDSLLDPLPLESMEKLAIEAIRRETVREFADLIFDWVPAGAETDEEGIDDGDE